jgi:hypothetical protein
MWTNESEFLRDLVGRHVRIVAADEQCLPPLPAMVLKEVSALGVVLADGSTSRFFPWHEVVEIYPVATAETEDAALEELEDVLLGANAEP